MMTSAWTSPWLLPLAALFPLLLAALPAIPALRRHQLHLLPIAAIPALWAGLFVPDEATVTLTHALMESTWTMDHLGRVFQLFTAFGWLVAGLFSISYLRDHPRKGPFAIPFLLAMSGNLLLPTAADAVTFYTGFGVMSFASWGLVVHAGTPEARRAGRVYMTLVLLGELMVFPGLVKGTLWAESSLLSAIRTHWTLDPDPRFQIALIFFGFALKAGLFPFHFWLPLAHPAAPAPASAVLSGCMIKAGLLAWLRLLPLGEFAMPILGQTITLLAGTSMIGALVIGLTQTHPKALLAYSSLSKMGMMMLLLAPAMIEPQLAPAAIAAVLVYATFHSLHKSALFLGTALPPSRGKTGLMILLCASFAGLPFLSGALAKTSVKTLLDHPAFPNGQPFAPLFALSALLTLLLMFRFLLLTQLRPSNSKPQAPSSQLPAPHSALSWTLAVLAALLFPLLAQHFDLSTNPGYAYRPVTALTAEPALWGGLLLIAVWAIFKPKLPFHIPPGDLLNLLPRISRPWLARMETLLEETETRLNGAPGGLAYLIITLLLVGLMVSFSALI
ncbi:MAG: NADH/ubiquinone/plastoquinone (complex I) [Verrucomicrobia bacterium]|nr:NADH/ubiquinone/plastoquinone (complex I) [Verrucomicrobiota bacterium]MCH8511142.1 NADH/ubiquinone/plastoquinone (complex I) [Kiritimatiellia bacterium]